jgi:hypothetical protein
MATKASMTTNLTAGSECVRDLAATKVLHLTFIHRARVRTDLGSALFFYACGTQAPDAAMDYEYLPPMLTTACSGIKFFLGKGNRNFVCNAPGLSVRLHYKTCACEGERELELTFGAKQLTKFPENEAYVFAPIAVPMRAKCTTCYTASVAKVAAQGITNIRVWDPKKLRSLIRIDQEAPPSASADAICSICMVNKIVVRLEPCGHAHMCVACIDATYRASAVFSCPYCRDAITEIFIKI